MNKLVKSYHAPVEATLGGAETLYPEYRKKRKAYVVPEKCSRYGCGWMGRVEMARRVPHPGERD